MTLPPRTITFVCRVALLGGVASLAACAGVEPHDLVMMKLAPGRTLEEVLTALNPERARRPDQRREPPASLESLGTFARGIAAVAPGMEVYLDATLPPGEHVMVCMATAPDGRSHIEHGMARQLTVR